MQPEQQNQEASNEAAAHITGGSNGAKEEEPRKPAQQILALQITEGLTEIERSSLGLFLAGIAAGLDMGFSVLLIGVVITLTGENFPPLFKEIFTAGAYSIGFILVVLGRSDLFTEHTTLAILPVLNRRATIAQLMRLWGIVYTSNLIGGGIFAFAIAKTFPAMGTIQPEAFHQMALINVSHPAWVILLGGVLAGWLMGLLSWLVAASRETISQIAIILLITGTIGMAHLQHSIAGSIEVLTGIFANQGITWLDFGHFLLWTTIGNIIGGTVLVGALRYAGAVRSNPNRPTVKIIE